MFPRHDDVGLILESFALNLMISTQLTNNFNASLSKNIYNYHFVLILV